MPNIPESPEPVLWIIYAGDHLYVFDDEVAADLQYHVCVAANLDVTCVRMTPSRWDLASAEFAKPEYAVTIVDVRPATGT